MLKVFEAKSYREFLKSELTETRNGKAARTRLAKALGVQPSFVSLVLTGRQHFSPLHGVTIGKFLSLSDEEIDGLILLIQRDRATSKELRAVYDRQLSQMRRRKNRIGERLVDNASGPGPNRLDEYYRTWYHIAVHMALRNSSYSGPDAIAAALSITPRQVRRSIAVLKSAGFIEATASGWRVKERRFHLAEDSLALRAHHTNWRLAATRSLDDRRTGDLHYTSVMSVDAEAAEKLRRIVVEFIESCEPVISDAKDEQVHVLTLDFLRVGG